MVKSESEASLLTPEEAAAFLAMPVLTLQTWRAHRTGPRYYKIGRRVRYRHSDLERWLQQQADPRPAE
jgi:excisionase family DNA binding protein